MAPVTVDGEQVKLAVITYKPAGNGPFPTLVFHHGSALRDIDAVTPVLLAQPFVDRSRFVVGGQSRGGVLTVAWAGLHPEMPRAAINFVGGWMGEGCSTAKQINQTLFKRGATYPQPMLWLYGDRDRFYSLAHSHSNFDAFQAAGGRGTFNEFAPPDGVNGHSISGYPALWADKVASYLAERGL